MAVLDNNELWCYGSKRIADNEQCPPVYEYKKMILRYDGTQWTNLRDSTVFDKNIDFQNIAVFQNKIWLRSDKELFTFDGTSWHMIDIDPLQDLTILKILPTNDYFWVLTDTGLYKYDGTSWQLIDLNLPDFPYIYNTFNLLADGDNLWIGYEKGIIKYNASNTEYFGSEHDIYICNSLHKTSNGDIWFTSYSDGGNIVADIIQYSNGSFTKQGVFNNRLYDRISVSDDKMWFFKKGYGISQFNNNQWTFYSATGLSDNLIKDINQDKAGNILISTRSGINSYNKAVNSWRILTHQPNSKFFNDNNNKIWMYRNQLQSIDEDENIQDEELIIQDEAISNIKSVFDFFQDENGVYYMIADMPYYKDGNSWVTFKPGISWFSLTSGVKKDDLLFVGSKKQGIIILGGQSIEWEKTTDISKNVSDLLKDSNNRIWCTRIDQNIDQDQCGLTYVDGGISVLDGDEWTYFTDLPIMDAFCIMEDNLGRIWFGTEKGVFVYAFGEWHNYNKDNSGLLSNKITTIFQDENNDIWIGTTVGITKIEDPNLLSMRIVKTENIDQIKWAIAPNPAQNFITINNSQSGNLSIVNSLGIQVYAYENFQGGNIDIHQLNPGLYFVGLEINNTISYQKLIIK